MTSKFLTVTLFVFVESQRCLMLYLLSVFVVCLPTKFYVAKLGTANSGRAAEGVGVPRSCFVTYESHSKPSLLKGSSSNTRQCSHLMDSFCAAELYQPYLSADGVVGIATRYGLEGPGIESQWGEIFRTYPGRLRGPPSLLYNGYRLFPGGKGGRDVMLTTHPF
jgi:hypothetical protein